MHDDEDYPDNKPDTDAYQGDVEPDLAQDEDEEKTVSKVQKRIDGLIAERARIKDEAARMAAELEALRAANMEREAASKDDDVRSVRDRISDLRSKARKAADEGDFEAEDKLREALLEAEAEFVERKVGRKVKPEQRQEHESQQQNPDQQQPYVSPKALEWGKKNSAWLNKPGHGRRTRMANQIFSDLVSNEGYSPDDEDTYAELDSLLNRMFDAKPKAAPRGPASGSEGRKPDKRGKTLSREDREMMQEFNLDPNNKIHVEEWIRQNRSAA